MDLGTLAQPVTLGNLFTSQQTSFMHGLMQLEPEIPHTAVEIDRKLFCPFNVLLYGEKDSLIFCTSMSNHTLDQLDSKW